MGESSLKTPEQLAMAVKRAGEGRLRTHSTWSLEEATDIAEAYRREVVEVIATFVQNHWTTCAYLSQVHANRAAQMHKHLADAIRDEFAGKGT
jgi:hypothetical protein